MRRTAGTSRVNGRWAASLILLSAIIAAPAVGATPVAAVVNDLLVTVAPTAPTLEDSVDITASSAQVPDGTTVSFHEPARTPSTFIGTAHFAGGTATLSKYGVFFGLGSHSVFAVVDSPAMTSPTSTFKVLRIPTTVSITVSPSVQANHPIQVGALVSASSGEGGTLDFFAQGALTPTCANVPWTGDKAWCWMPPVATTGTVRYRVTFSGSQSYAPASAKATVQITPDVVEAWAEVEYGWFYPVTDGFRDTNRIYGERGELTSVEIKVYNPWGTLVKSASIPKGTGSYSVTWDGRLSDGRVLAEGTYEVVQTLTDAFGTKKTVTDSVVLSRKRLYYHTQTITKLGSSASVAAGYLGTAFLYPSSGYARLSPGTGYAQVAYTFTLPSAVVYKSVTFKVYAKHVWSTGDETKMGARLDWISTYPTYCGNPDNGPAPLGCFGGWRGLGNSAGTTAWFATSALGSSYTSGRLFQGLVHGVGRTTYVYKAQVVVVYGVMGY